MTTAEVLARKHQRTVDQVRDSNLKRLYGISLREYNSMREAQDYRCAICWRHEDDLPIRARGGRPRKDGLPKAESMRLVVDHCHIKGNVRALLCQGCNHGIAAFDEDIERMMRAVLWLKEMQRS